MSDTVGYQIIQVIPLTELLDFPYKSFLLTALKMQICPLTMLYYRLNLKLNYRLDLKSKNEITTHITFDCKILETTLQIFLLFYHHHGHFLCLCNLSYMPFSIGRNQGLLQLTGHAKLFVPPSKINSKRQKILSTFVQNLEMTHADLCYA